MAEREERFVIAEGDEWVGLVSREEEEENGFKGRVSLRGHGGEWLTSLLRD